jgi:hypothetical protein
MISPKIQESWFCCQKVLEDYDHSTQAEGSTYEFQVFCDLIEAIRERNVMEEVAGYPGLLPNRVVEVMTWVGPDCEHVRAPAFYYFTQCSSQPTWPWTEISVERFSIAEEQFKPKFTQVIWCPVHGRPLQFVVWRRPIFLKAGPPGRLSQREYLL